VDARLETQLQKITKAVERAFEEESVESVNIESKNVGTENNSPITNN
jgi:hypothetical protein